MNSRVVNFILKSESLMGIVKTSETEFTYEDYLDASKFRIVKILMMKFA